MSHWADEPAERPARSKSKTPTVPQSGFDQLTFGEHGQSVAKKQAPAEIVLPKRYRCAVQRSRPRCTRYSNNWQFEHASTPAFTPMRSPSRKLPMIPILHR